MITRWFWREWRSPSLLIVWLALSLAVACVLALGSVSDRMEKGLSQQSREFMALFTKLCEEEYPYTAFADAFHTVRSMLLPVLWLASCTKLCASASWPVARVSSARARSVGKIKRR